MNIKKIKLSENNNTKIKSEFKLNCLKLKSQISQSSTNISIIELITDSVTKYNTQISNNIDDDNNNNNNTKTITSSLKNRPPKIEKNQLFSVQNDDIEKIEIIENSKK